MADNRMRYEDFDAIVTRHKTLIRRLCWWHADGNSSLCADLMQEAVTALWHYRHTLRPEATAQQERLWVKYHCRSVFSHRRRRKNLDTVPLNEKIDFAEPTNSHRETIEDLAIGLTLHEHQMLDLLLEGYNIAEIAELMNIKPASASTLRQRIIAKMRQTYEEQNRE